jgi:hypothetical protein
MPVSFRPAENDTRRLEIVDGRIADHVGLPDREVAMMGVASALFIADTFTALTTAGPATPSVSGCPTVLPSISPMAPGVSHPPPVSLLLISGGATAELHPTSIGVPCSPSSALTPTRWRWSSRRPPQRRIPVTLAPQTPPPQRTSADLIRGTWGPPEPSGFDELVSGAGSDVMNGGDCAGDDVIDGRPARP